MNINEIRTRNSRAMDVVAPGNRNEQYWGPRDRDHLLKVIDLMEQANGICPYGAHDHEGPYGCIHEEGKPACGTCIRMWADKQAGE